jgi:large subunit ribosomal protein L35
MPKMKSHSSSKKRFKITGTGKVKRNKAYKTHILTKKSTKRKRNLRKATTASSANEAIIKNMIPYK